MFSTTSRRKWNISWNLTNKNTVKMKSKQPSQNFRPCSKHNAVQKADFVHSTCLLHRLSEIRLPRSALHQYCARSSFFIYFELFLPPIWLPGSPIRFLFCFNLNFRRQRTLQTRKTGNTTCLTSEEQCQLMTVWKRKLKSARDLIRISFRSSVALQGMSVIYFLEGQRIQRIIRMPGLPVFCCFLIVK